MGGNYVESRVVRGDELRDCGGDNTVSAADRQPLKIENSLSGRAGALGRKVGVVPPAKVVVAATVACEGAFAMISVSGIALGLVEAKVKVRVEAPAGPEAATAVAVLADAAGALPVEEAAAALVDAEDPEAALAAGAWRA